MTRKHPVNGSMREKRQMTITMENCKRAPSWETTQQMLREVLKQPEGKLTNIVKEGSGDTRGLGSYNLVFKANGAEKHIVLNIRSNG